MLFFCAVLTSSKKLAFSGTLPGSRRYYVPSELPWVLHLSWHRCTCLPCNFSTHLRTGAVPFTGQSNQDGQSNPDDDRRTVGIAPVFQWTPLLLPVLIKINQLISPPIEKPKFPKCQWLSCRTPMKETQIQPFSTMTISIPVQMTRILDDLTMMK